MKKRASRGKSPLKSLIALLQSHGWEADLCRLHCTDARNPHNCARTVAKMNAVVAWRPGRVAHVCWIWEIGSVSEGELVARIEGKKEAA